MQFFLHGLRHTQTVGCCLNQPHKCDGCLLIYASVLGFVSHLPYYSTDSDMHSMYIMAHVLVLDETN